MDTYDLLIFSGQSNMVGESGSFPKRNPKINRAYEYKYLSDSLTPVKHPCGEDIDGHLQGAAKGHGGLMPHFCEQYIKDTNRNVIAVHAAKGASVISEWIKKTPKYNVLIKKILAARKKLTENYSLGHILFIWLQGESDAIHSTSESDYYNMLMSFKNDIMVDIGAEKFMIIRVGRFTGDERDDQIINAQLKICNEDDDFIMLTEAAEYILKDTINVNPNVAGHYSNRGYKLLGEAAGKAAARYISSKHRAI